MTFPQSTFPTDRQTTWSVVSMYEANKPYDRPWVVYATRFPILRSSPLWAQTWVDGRGAGTSGYWFPPLRCVTGWRLRRAFPYKWIWDSPIGGFQYRLYSSPRCRCATCLENAQTVELMLVGFESIGRADAWPNEHRCWFGHRASSFTNEWLFCSCGVTASITDVFWWREMVDQAIDKWALSNRVRRDSVGSYRLAFA